MTFLAEIKDKKDDDAPEEEDEDDLVFDQTPVRVVCPHCGLNVITFIEHESSWVTYVTAVVLLLTLGWAALCVVPIVYPLFKDVVHHCPRCLNVLATRSRVAITGFRSEVMSLRFGSCVVVLARKWVLLLVGLSVLIGGIHWCRSSHSSSAPADMPKRGPVQSATWEEFSKDCGYKSYLGNPIHVTVAFSEKYKEKTFRWEGALHHIEDGFSFLWFNQRGALYARMSPSQFSTRRDVPDIVLLFDDADQVGLQALKLKRGTAFSFEATMVEVGRRGSPHVMALWAVHPARARSSAGRPEASGSARHNSTIASAEP